MPDITYVTVPEYQPSSASLVIDPFYKTSGKTENITVRRTGLDTGTLLLIGFPMAIFFGWLLLRKS